ncbi:MAG: amidohydrolase [Planctomycetes bacterium]|nr:amidohydrolase [Planctomycetota bacterium]
MIMPWKRMRRRVESLLPQLVALRHDLHRHPELGFAERRTQGVVLEWLESHGYRPRRCADTGVVADLRDGEPAVLAIRADLDALPMQEETDLPYRSTHDGVAHKCGHDGHTAIGLGVAALLAEERGTLPGNVRLLFQPAEEGVRGGGARVMVAEGALDGVAEVYGLHNWPGFPKGEVRVAAGPVMAQVDSVSLVLCGVGGHGSQPQHCRDPIVAGAQVITAAQTVVSRHLSALESGVVSFGSFHAGRANNVIPGRAELLGSIRSLSPTTRQRIHDGLRQVVEGVAAGMGVHAELRIDSEYPVLRNDVGCAEAVGDAARALGVAVADAGLPLLASEDFAYFAQARPSAYFFLGAGSPVGTTPGCHHPDFDFDDDLLSLGVSMFLAIAELRLAAQR